MDAPATGELLRLLGTVPDPRRHNTRHRLSDILTIALLATICGAGGFVEIVAYARSKEQWLSSFLDLPCGIPSHDTFSRVFARLHPDALEAAFRQWTTRLAEHSAGRLVAIDGKSLRRSFANGWDKAGMAHMVSAFAQDNHLVLAQVKADGKGHELDGVEQLLQLLDLHGAVVTADALSCQVKIAALLAQAKADYLLQVKDNQPTLHARLQTLFQEAVLEKFQGWHADTCQTTDGDHDRIETRQVTVLWDVQHLGALAKPWARLKSLVCVERTREVPGPQGWQRSSARHFYLSSLDRRRTARQFLAYSRGHWSVENNLHWQLDVNFHEDQRRIRRGHGAENFSRLCRMALNLLVRELTHKVGIHAKRLTCGWDNQYLLKVLAG
jgi:predicted transposase YbfD/YdcC